MNRKPLVAIVGKPNVGKSSLFNCLIGDKVAIISEVAGTTRDRIYGSSDLGNLDAIIIDTGGLEYGKKKNIEADIYSQAILAMEEADLIVFLVDGSEQITINDDEAIKLLREKKKDVVFVANKVDRKSTQEVIHELYKCGLGKPIEISAAHNRNIEEVKEVIEKKLRGKGFRKIHEKKEKRIKIAIVGRPNVGKSSLTNALLGEKKIIVSDIPGTTRDAIDTELTFKKQEFLLIDTAGIRRRGKIGRKIEYWSMLRGIRALEQCDIGVLVLDASEGIVNQDQHIAGFVAEEKKGLVIVLNKIDLIPGEEERQKLLMKVKRSFPFIPWAPVIMTSALTSENIKMILDLALEIMQERNKELDSKILTDYLQEISLYHAAKTKKSTHPKLFKMQQIRVNPPTFIIEANDPELFHFSYRRYLERKIREKYGFNGTAIKMYIEKKKWK